MSATSFLILFGILSTLVSLLLFTFIMYKCYKKVKDKKVKESDRPYLDDFTVGLFIFLLPFGLGLISFIKILQIGVNYFGK